MNKLVLIGLLICCTSACSDKNERRVHLNIREPIAPPAVAQTDELKLGMGAMITPKEGFAYYKRLKEFVEGQIGRPIKLVDRETYDEFMDMLRNGDIDAGFACSGVYVEAHDSFGIEILAVPQSRRKTTYRSYIIVPVDSTAKNLKDLKGKCFAFTDPQSNSGSLAPMFLLGQLGERPETFFKKFVYTYGHDKSIKAVAEKLVDGAAVDSLIWNYMQRTNPEVTAKTKVIVKSPPFGIPPIVVRRGLPTDIKEKLRYSLLHMHESAEGKAILAGMMIERFVPGNDRQYDSIRTMKAWLKRQKGMN